MSEINPGDVPAAFEILFEEVEAELDFVNGVGLRAFQDHDIDKTKEYFERSGMLRAFRDKITVLQSEWAKIAAKVDRDEDRETHERSRIMRKLPRGIVTPHSAFVIPILRALEQMGGRAKPSEVIERVGRLMEGVLNPVDNEPQASSPEYPRWRKTAEWTRKDMIEDGLLSDDSPNGIWEITQKGRTTLAQADHA